MRLSVFSPKPSAQLFIDLKKLYKGYLSDQQLTEDALKLLVDAPEKQFFVSLFNARHLGAVQVSVDQNKAVLSLLCVRDLTRRRGVGKNLLSEVEKQLREKKINCVSLSLTGIQENEQDGTVLFMQSCGYQHTENILNKSL